VFILYYGKSMPFIFMINVGSNGTNIYACRRKGWFKKEIET
jgi:hypothetical protein